MESERRWKAKENENKTTSVKSLGRALAMAARKMN